MTRMSEQQAAELGAAYAFQGPALELGAGPAAGTPHPAARVRVPLSMLNRHGLIAGATGTGKTKTLQVIAEQLSAAGGPVVLSDAKGDLGARATPAVGARRGQSASGGGPVLRAEGKGGLRGIAAAGEDSGGVRQRAAGTGYPWQ